jgi:Fe-S-cluster containining protein
MTESAESAADGLCMSCGLCCDGTFFGSVVVAKVEREKLDRVGLRIVEHDGALSMPQRCSALRGCLCAVYDDRPNACVQYECSLRKSVISGSTSVDHARANISRMRVLLGTIREAFDVPATTSIWEAILALEEPMTAEESTNAAREYAAGIDAVTELLKLGRDEFEPQFAGGGRR